MIAIMMLSFWIEEVDARGKKKKKRTSSNNGGPTCESLGLDCSATCCIDIVCADFKSECAGYINRDYDEIYIGFGSIIAIVIGIPLSLKLVNFCLTYKFC